MQSHINYLNPQLLEGDNTRKELHNLILVFDHEASQEDVFLEISQLVQGALDGHKVCIFAYGQTSSGKTYTMMGKNEPPEEKGLIPRSLEHIFVASQSLGFHGLRYTIQASMLEIYNENIRDLLLSSRPDSVKMSCNKQFTIKKDKTGNTHAPGLTMIDVHNIEDVSVFLKQATQNRTVGKTRMNEESSRSHFVFILRISRGNDDNSQPVQGILNLIDLAGSERVDKSCSIDDRLKETRAINTSLAALGDVISLIAKKEPHVAYRNSKLTYLLEPCLDRDSKTLMFVNISPEASSANESLYSLRFAARVNSCQIGVSHHRSQKRYTLLSRRKYKI
ncbi:Kinesin-1 [Platanthera guangdongensis]|uniref:Kinesin-1 n=1 Tax=Platanthera guangdongensis TaxID=2320717 RepID=A0ABR2M730_9ASPA